MDPNPILGILLHAIGGFAAGSFYAPLKKVNGWAWETYWLIMGVVAWLIVPWIVAWMSIPNLWATLSGAPPKALGWMFLFGVFWGVAGVTFGLTMRYLGMALGMAMVLGLTAVIGTLVPPIYHGRAGELLFTSGGQAVLAGLLVCCAGVIVCGRAGILKERDSNDGGGGNGVAEFNLRRGFFVALVSGILSACFAFGLAAAGPVSALAIENGANPLFSTNAALVVIVGGGLVTNLIWCLMLNWRNRTFGDYARGKPRARLFNYGLCAIAGFIWYHQFFFYGMGTTQLGERYDFSSWTLHMAFIIIFSNLWGLGLGEWKGSRGKTMGTLFTGLAILILSTIIIGYGNTLTDVTSEELGPAAAISD